MVEELLPLTYEVEVEAVLESVGLKGRELDRRRGWMPVGAFDVDDDEDEDGVGVVTFCVELVLGCDVGRDVLLDMVAEGGAGGLALLFRAAI